MSNITVNIKRLDPTVELPKYAHPTDAGLDLRSNEDCILKPFERRLVSTGLAIAPARWLRRLRPAPKRFGHQAGPVYSQYAGPHRRPLPRRTQGYPHQLGSLQQHPNQQRRPHSPTRHPRSPHGQPHRSRRTRRNRPRQRRLRLLRRRLGALVSLPPASHTYHSMLKHSRFASLAAKLRVERYV